MPEQRRMIFERFYRRTEAAAFWHAALLLLVCFFSIAATECARLPDVETVNAVEAGEKSPDIIDARKQLSDRESNAVIDKLKQEAGPTDILERHILLEEEISGKPLVQGNRVTLLRDGPETLAAMNRAIQGAKHHIHLETFIIRDDKVGRPLADLLLQRRSEGVQVRVIYDSFGCKTTPSAFFERMQAGGIQVYEFNPIGTLDLEKKRTINNRDHRKILIVDGRIAFTGGINFYRTYAGSPSSSGGKPAKGDEDAYWRDTHIQIEGPAVADLQRLFFETWNSRSEKETLGADYFPRLEDKGDALIRVISSTPEQPIPNIYAAYLSAINNAQEAVYITQAYLLPGDEMLQALAQSAGKGVDVKIIVPGVSDFWVPVYAGRSDYSYLLKSGVKLYEHRAGMLHSKTAVIDGVWSTVGSSNMDSRSFLHDAEVNAVILSRDFALKMEGMFKADLAESDEVLLEQWEKRPFPERVKEWFSRIFRYWL